MQFQGQYGIQMNSIFITGGTGSFGHALVKKILVEDILPSLCIAIYSRDEHKQEKMAANLKQYDQNQRLRFFIGDIRDKERLSLAMRTAVRVIHTAALKVVPTAEYNPFECIKTNVIGSQNLVDCCLNARNNGSHIKMIALSTDKAVAPKNLYGATKLCMEKLVLAANNIHGEYGPKFSICRYGNVANSNGSVIQVFKSQREQGLPLTVTDPRMTRYWITLDEAVKFVLDSLGKMQGGEVFIPDMPSFRVADLAMAMSDAVSVTGVRAGEKIHEQLDEGRTSDNNALWLSQRDLEGKLQELGVLP